MGGGLISGRAYPGCQGSRIWEVGSLVGEHTLGVKGHLGPARLQSPFTNEW